MGTNPRQPTQPDLLAILNGRLISRDQTWSRSLSS